MPSKQVTQTKNTTISRVQTVVQVNIFRYKNGQPNFLLFKRIDADNDHFWQPVSQPVTSGQPVDEVLQRVSSDQAGIVGLHYLSDELYTYDWYATGQRGRDVIFAGEVKASTLVFPDLKLYDSFAWMPYKEALLKLKWDGNKQSLRQLMDHLEKRQAEQLTELNNPIKPIKHQLAPRPFDQSDQNNQQIEHTRQDNSQDGQNTKDLTDELIPNYRTEDDGEDNSVFPL